ncbi:hypothetical protein [Luteimonas deserti]|nr:hypothetical protein [Luteimonas deserti]
MVFLYVLAAAVAVWAAGALQLVAGPRHAGRVAAVTAGVLASAFVACLAYGVYGLVGHGDWSTVTHGQALHGLLGEGSLALRRTGWTALDRAANALLNTNIGWSLFALSAIQFQSIGFWARRAEARRRRRRVH